MKIKAVEVKPLTKPCVVDVEDTLEEWQRRVGGNIQAVYPFDDMVAIICDVEGKLKNYLPCRFLFDENGYPYDLLVGTFYVVGLVDENGNDDGNFHSLSEDLIEKYISYF